MWLAQEPDEATSLTPDFGRGGAAQGALPTRLKIASEARKAALDMRLVTSGAPEHPRSKLNLADEIAAVDEDTEHDRGIQLAFLDLGTPKGRRRGTHAGRRGGSDRRHRHRRGGRLTCRRVRRPEAQARRAWHSGARDPLRAR